MNNIYSHFLERLNQKLEFFEIREMPNKGKGGKKKRRGKNTDVPEKRILEFREDGQEYARVTKMLGDGRLQAKCSDGKTRVCHIRGKMRKRVWINPEDLILVDIRQYQPDKADVVYKYNPDEDRTLCRYGELTGGTAKDDIDDLDPDDDCWGPDEPNEPNESPKNTDTSLENTLRNAPCAIMSTRISKEQAILISTEGCGNDKCKDNDKCMRHGQMMVDYYNRKEVIDEPDTDQPPMSQRLTNHRLTNYRSTDETKVTKPGDKSTIESILQNL